MRSLALLIAVAACGPRRGAPPPHVPEAQVPTSPGCPTGGRLRGRILDANSRDALSPATVVATTADGTRLVAITDEYGRYCIETSAADVHVDIYFGDVASRQLVRLDEGWPATMDLFVETTP